MIKSVLAELEAGLLALDDESYKTPSNHLFNATIGQHVRHIIELFQCLLAGYSGGFVNYDRRKRDQVIETDRQVAVALLREIALMIRRQDKAILLETTLGMEGESITIHSNFHRELVYNLEHMIHHMALIRVGVRELTNISLPDTFGVAPATVKYRKTCAQ